MVGAGDAEEALRLLRRREQPLSQLEGDDLVLVAVGDEDRRGHARQARQRVEPVARERAERAVVPARDVGQPRERRHRDDRPARAPGGDLDGDRPAQGFPEAHDGRRVRPARHQVVEGGGRVEVDAGLVGRALAAPVAAVVVGEDPESAGGQRGQQRPARVDVPRVAVRPQEHRAAVARRDVPRVQAHAVRGGDPALLHAGGRRPDPPVGKEDEAVEPHDAAGQQEERGNRERGPGPHSVDGARRRRARDRRAARSPSGPGPPGTRR